MLLWGKRVGRLPLVNVLLASPLAPELVKRIAAVDPRVHLVWRPELLGTPRYPGDHSPPIGTDAQSAEWRRLVGEAEVMLDVDQPSAPDVVQLAPRLRWVQSSSSGVGEWIRRLKLVEAPIVVTNAAGMHARPLAEYVVFAMLYFARRWPRMAAEQHAHHWERCAVDTLEGKTLGSCRSGQRWPNGGAAGQTVWCASNRHPPQQGGRRGRPGVDARSARSRPAPE